MRRFMCDVHLESARIFQARGKSEARTAWAQAREMIDQMGYHRRDKDLQEIA
jgi:hypothetical protein